MTLQTFAAHNPLIFWSTKNYKGLSDEAIVEGVLEHGSWEDVQKVISIIGKERTADIFFKCANMPRNNFSPKVENYFRLYFEDAHRNTKS